MVDLNAVQVRRLAKNRILDRFLERLGQALRVVVAKDERPRPVGLGDLVAFVDRIVRIFVGDWSAANRISSGSYGPFAEPARN